MEDCVSMLRFTSNRKADTKKNGRVEDWKIAYPCCDSLQTGKQIQRRMEGWKIGRLRIHVAIHFKRESRYKGLVNSSLLPKGKGFNSLQTGKHIQSDLANQINEAMAKCFNSLQTGKHIQRRTHRKYLPMGPPSFNSLQTGKHIQRFSRGGNVSSTSVAFQFPSNGKAYTKIQVGVPKEIVEQFVSIPFKRESIYKGKSTPRASSSSLKGFNSLQTGKHIQSLFNFSFFSVSSDVSIPFKRESIYKGGNKTRY